MWSSKHPERRPKGPQSKDAGVAGVLRRRFAPLRMPANQLHLEFLLRSALARFLKQYRGGKTVNSRFYDYTF
jgi:hypothetical protein